MNLDQTVGHELEWRQPEILRRIYQLTCNGSEVAILSFESRYGSLATGECGQGKWTFKRTGFLSPRVSIREAGSETDLAIFTPGWTGSGSLAFGSGRRYQLRPTNFWHTEWAFQTEDGNPAVTLSGPHGVFKQGGNAGVAQSAAGSPETPVMLLLIWYLRILMNADAAAGAAVVACSG
ncbi:MAG: hypothetical protein ABSH32_11105 [Bryobacteraceae bacterium]|jgi:hypothetical protein